MAAFSVKPSEEVYVDHVEVSSQFLHFWARRIPTKKDLQEMVVTDRLPSNEGYVPTVGEVFTMKTSDESRGWHRFKMISPITDGRAEVIDLDYGGVQSESISDPRPLSEFAKEYRLAGCMFSERRSGLEARKAAAKSRFEELVVTNNNFPVHIQVLSDDDVPLASLNENIYTSILIDEYLMIRISLPEEEDEESQKENVTHPRSSTDHEKQYLELLVMLLLLRCYKSERKFWLAVDYKPAEEFKQVYLRFKKDNGEMYHLYMSLKHSSNQRDMNLSKLLERPRLINFFTSYKKLSVNEEKLCIIYTDLYLNADNTIEDQKIDYPDIFSGPVSTILKEGAKIKGFSSKIENSEDFQLFRQQFLVAHGQSNIDKMKELVIEEISKMCKNKKKETRNLLNSYRCWILDWMQKAVGTEIDLTIVSEFFRRNLDELQDSDMIGQIKLTEIKLGKGINSIVYIGLDGTHEVAVKRVACRDEQAAEKAAEEADIYRKLKFHKNIVGYRAMDIKDNHFFIAMEKCSCTLEAFIKSKENISDQKKLNMLQDILEGLSHLHDNQIIHSDLSPRNILVEDSGTGEQPVLKVSDFGYSKDTSVEDPDLTASSSMKGTRGYIAPECLYDLEDFPSDVYVLGLLMFYLWTDGQHFYKLNRGSRGLQNVDVEIPKELKTTYDYLLQNALTAMLKVNMDERPTCSDLLGHPLFWTEEKMIMLYEKVNALKEDCCIVKMEAVKDHVFTNDWRNDLTDEMRQALLTGGNSKRVTKYDHSKLKHLVRAIRNWMAHIDEYEDLVPSKDKIGMLRLWHERFPKLLSVLWTCLQWPCQHPTNEISDPDVIADITLKNLEISEQEKNNLQEFYPPSYKFPQFL